MNHLNILLFIGGIGVAEGAILIVIFAVAGFFIWRALLKFLLNKGSRGINIAAIIMGVFQSPILAMLLLVMTFWIIEMQQRSTMPYERDELSVEEGQEEMKHYNDSLASRRMVRLAKLVIDADRLEEYKAALTEEIETALNDEPGVTNLYAVFEKNNPTSLTILEIYADSASYANHLKTPHFLKYKNETKDMVKSLELKEVVALPGLEFY